MYHGRNDAFNYTLDMNPLAEEVILIHLSQQNLRQECFVQRLLTWVRLLIRVIRAVGWRQRWAE